MSKRLATVLLEHRTREGRHFDWLLVDPTAPRGPLWTVRVRIPSSRWSAARTWALVLIAAHRRRYLRYQGPLSGGRGRVRRIDEGSHIPRAWSRSRILVELSMKQFQGLVELRRVSGGRWRAYVRQS